MARKLSQTITGKAFEYSLLNAFYERLTNVTSVDIIRNRPYYTAHSAYTKIGEIEQSKNNLAASFAVNFIIDLEPRLNNSKNVDDVLQLEIVSDDRGKKGDVRDVLAIRSAQQWEIGISAKHNHRAMKHPRLSNTIDFGKLWLGLPCNQEYFDEISPIFNELEKIRVESGKKQIWTNLGDYHLKIYQPVLNALWKELERLNKQNPGIVAERLINYLIGNQDFYKVIKGRNRIEIQAYNLYGTLNLPFMRINPKARVPKLKLPNRLIDIVYQEDSTTTLLVTLNEGWQISFRIHNASSRVEPSLKFDINLVSAPHSLFINQLFLPSE